jgi:MFS family permease
MTITKQTRRKALTFAMFAGAALSGFAVRALGPMPPWALIIWIMVLIAVAFWIAMYCWSLLDEAQKEAHKWAWYWGGSFGLLIGLVAMTLALRIDPHLVDAIKPNASPKRLVELGYGAAAFSTLIGYGVAWAAWWLKRR